MIFDLSLCINKRVLNLSACVIHLFLAVLVPHRRVNCYLMAAGGSYSLVSVRGLLLGDPSLRGPQAQGTGSVVVMHGRPCSMACGLLLRQKLSPCLLHCQADSLPLREVLYVLLLLWKKIDNRNV